MKRRIVIFVFIITLASFILFINNDSPDNQFSSIPNYYLENFEKDTFTENTVASIYLNYRVFDSIFETLILLVSVTGVINFSWRRPND